MIVNRNAFLAFAAIFAASAIVPETAAAFTQTATILVSATSLSDCLVVATPLAFGNHSQTLTTATATVTVTCTPTTTYAVTLNGGTTTGGTTSARLMFNTIASTTLAYSLYTDSGHVTPWTTNSVAGTGTGLPQIISVYGTIAASLLVTPGVYGDSVTATLTY